VAGIWNHPKNARLKEMRSNPEVLAPCDVIGLPENKPRTYSISPGQDLTVTVPNPKRKVEVRLCDFAGQPLAGKTFEVDGRKEDPPLKTDGKGVASFTIGVLTSRVILHFTELDIDIPVNVGGLDPHDTTSGAVGRLTNLGFYVWQPRTGEQEEAYLEHVFEEFQRQQGLEVTGKLDKPTMAKLCELGGEDGTWA